MELVPLYAADFQYYLLLFHSDSRCPHPPSCFGRRRGCYPLRPRLCRRPKQGSLCVMMMPFICSCRNNKYTSRSAACLLLPSMRNARSCPISGVSIVHVYQVSVASHSLPSILDSATLTFQPSVDHPPALRSVASVRSLIVLLWLALRGILALRAFAGAKR
jgi:hypothetical protein